MKVAISSMLLFASLNSFGADCTAIRNDLNSQIDAKLSVIAARIEKDKQVLMNSDFVKENLKSEARTAYGDPIQWIGAGSVVNGSSVTYVNIYLRNFGALNQTINAFSAGEGYSAEDKSEDVQSLKGLIDSLKRKEVEDFVIEGVSYRQDLSQIKSLKLDEISISFPELGEVRKYKNRNQLVRNLMLPKKCGGTNRWEDILETAEK